VSTFVRLLFVICTCVITPAFAGGPAPVEPEQPASQSSAPAASDAASQPATAAPSTTANAASNAATTPATSTTQSPNAATASKVVLVDKTMTDAQVKQLLAKGYKPQSRGSDVFYCRREAVLGSRFEQKICKSAEQVMRDELDSKDMTQRLQENSGSPAAN
jgi:hypothetical protein